MVNNKQWNILLDGRNLSSIEIFYAVLKNRGITDIDEFLHPSDIIGAYDQRRRP